METIKHYKELLEAAKNKFRCEKDFGIRGNVDSVLEFIRKESGLLEVPILHRTAVDLINDLTKEAFARTDPKKRFVFIPHCLRNIKECRATCGDEGYDCRMCGKCKIGTLVNACRKKDIKCYIVGGGSQLINIVKKYQPSALVGIACFTEIKMGIDKMLEIGIPCQAVMLSRCGCVNTDVDVKEALEKIKM